MANDLNFDLDLNALGLRTTGRAKKPVAFSLGREITDEDLALTQEEGIRRSDPKLTKIRERHHTLAKMLAQGVPQVDAGIACGYNQSRISLLMTDPSFKELLTFYKNEVNARYFDMHEAAAALGRDAVEELHERLEAEPEKFTVGQLLTLSTSMMDRVGHGPSSSTNVNVNIGLADKLEAARKRVASMRDITPPEAA